MIPLTSSANSCSIIQTLWALGPCHIYTHTHLLVFMYILTLTIGHNFNPVHYRTINNGHGSVPAHLAQVTVTGHYKGHVETHTHTHTQKQISKK